MDQTSMHNAASNWNKALSAATIFGSVLYVTAHAPYFGMNNFPLFSEGALFGCMNELIRRTGMLVGRGVTDLFPEKTPQGKYFYPPSPRPLKWSSLLVGFATSAVLLTTAMPQVRKASSALAAEEPHLLRDLIREAGHDGKRHPAHAP